MSTFRPLNLAIFMILLGVLLINTSTCSPVAQRSNSFRMKKWYTWNNDLEVTKKWYDWQNVPHALQQKRQLDVDDFVIE